MEEVKGSLGNKKLVILLCVLVVVIVGLIVGIVVVKNRPKEIVEEEVISEEVAAYNEYVDDYDTVDAQADRLLAQSSPNVEAVTKLYREYIDKYVAEGSYTDLVRAASYVTAETEKLLAKGFKQEVLDELVTIDMSVFSEPEQYRQYMTILDIAEDLNDEDVIAKYEPLAASVREAFLASCRGTAEIAEEYGAQNDANPLCNEDGGTK